jgi:hypothetical protein
MGKARRAKPPELDSDYDGAWKDSLRQHFREMLATYFPAIAALIDWRFPVEWSDKELDRILGRAKRRAQHVDVLAKARLLDGGEQWIMLHLEIQSSREAGFEYRLARYNSGLFWAYNRSVVTLVVLANLDQNWRPSEYLLRIADFECRLRFPTCKLIDKLESEWRGDHSLPVQVARAQIEALRTASDPEGRFLAKWQLVRNLYDLGYNADELREIFRLIDRMMSLPEELSLEFERQLGALEESLNMPYVTSVERIAEARGKALGEARGEARGIAIGVAALVLRQLARLDGPLPEEFEQQVKQLPLERLEALGEAILDFNSLDDARSWLHSHP